MCAHTQQKLRFVCPHTRFLRFILGKRTTVKKIWILKAENDGIRWIIRRNAFFFNIKGVPLQTHKGKKE